MNRFNVSPCYVVGVEGFFGSLCMVGFLLIHGFADLDTLRERFFPYIFLFSLLYLLSTMLLSYTGCYLGKRFSANARILLTSSSFVFLYCLHILVVFPGNYTTLSFWSGKIGFLCSILGTLLYFELVCNEQRGIKR